MTEMIPVRDANRLGDALLIGIQFSAGLICFPFYAVHARALREKTSRHDESILPFQERPGFCRGCGCVLSPHDEVRHVPNERHRRGMPVRAFRRLHKMDMRSLFGFMRRGGLDVVVDDVHDAANDLLAIVHPGPFAPVAVAACLRSEQMKRAHFDNAGRMTVCPV